MPGPPHASRKVRFGEFELNLDTAELHNNGHKAALPAQPFQVLLALLDQPGQLITREALKRRLWPSDTFVDFDQSLNKAVNRLREAFADSADNPRYIETLPKRGYRFICPLNAAVNGHGNLTEAEASLHIAGEAITERKRRRIASVLGVGALFVASVLGGLWIYRLGKRGAAGSTRPKRLFPASPK